MQPAGRHRRPCRAGELDAFELIGLTAPPFGMTTGMICSPQNLLNEVCYEIGVEKSIVAGYLRPLKARAAW